MQKVPAFPHQPCAPGVCVNSLMSVGTKPTMTSTPARGKDVQRTQRNVRTLYLSNHWNGCVAWFAHQHGSELSTSVPAIGTFRFFHRDVSVGAVKKPPEKKKTEPPGRTRKSPQHKQVGHSDSSGAHLAVRCVQEHEPNTLTEQCCR